MMIMIHAVITLVLALQSIEIRPNIQTNKQNKTKQIRQGSKKKKKDAIVLRDARGIERLVPPHPAPLLFSRRGKKKNRVYTKRAHLFRITLCYKHLG